MSDMNEGHSELAPRLSNYARVPCQVLRARRNEDSGWLVVYETGGGRKATLHFHSEDDAKAAQQLISETLYAKPAPQPAAAAALSADYAEAGIDAIGWHARGQHSRVE